MFQNLRPQTPFYILYRGENPKVEIGSVVSVSTPVAKPSLNFNALYPQQPEMVVDVKVKVGNSTLNFEKLPANSVIADFSMNNSQDPTHNVVISSNRDMIKTEIESMLSQSKGIIDSISYHQSVIAGCEDMLKIVNPSFAKEKEQESTIIDLKKELGEMKELFHKYILQQASSQSKNQQEISVTSNENNETKQI